MRDYDFDEDEPYVVIEKRSGGMSSFLLGLAVGAGLALLFAPQSGLETRRSLSRNARKVRRAAEDAVGEVTEKVGETFETARQRVEEKIDEARTSIEVKKEQVQRAMQAGREAAQQARADLERRLAETKAAYNAGAQVARDAREARAASPPKGRTV
jgi:gas vesicle protein